MQVRFEFAFDENSFTASLFHFCDPVFGAFAAVRENEVLTSHHRAELHPNQ